VDAAAAIGLPIVEDNPYGDLWFDTPPPAPLSARAGDGAVYLGSFSKVLAPGLRLGYLVAPKALYPKLLQAKQAADLHSPGFNQRLVHEVIKDGFLLRHVPQVRARYKAQRDAMQSALMPTCRRAAAGRRRSAACSSGSNCRPRWTPRRCCPGGGGRRGLRAGRDLLRPRAAAPHDAPELRDRRTRDHRARRGGTGRGAAAGASHMSDARRFHQLDVFTAEPLRGNPLAVVHGADGLSDERMAAFARWTNLSETTFLLPPTEAGPTTACASSRPGGELPFAGHPTLGSCHAWLAAGGTAGRPGVVVQQCGVGLVRVRRDGTRLAFAAPPLRRSGPLELAAAQAHRALAAPGARRRAAPPVGRQRPRLVRGDAALGRAGAVAETRLRRWVTLKLGVVGAHAPGQDTQFEVRAFVPSMASTKTRSPAA
jgi:predicted PhzF superfamily epimerase YddE/YHI9